MAALRAMRSYSRLEPSTELASLSPSLPGVAHIARHKCVSTTTQYVHSNRAQTRAVLNARPGIPVTIPVTDTKSADLNHVASVVVPQNIIRRGIIGAVSAKATKRTEPEPSPALPTAQHPRARHGICLCPAQCAHLTLMPDAAWDQDAR